MKGKHLLIADDKAEFGAFVQEVAEMMGYKVRCTNSGREFISVYEDFDPSHVIVDLFMPDMDGIELLHWLAGRSCTAKILIMSGYNRDITQMAESLGKVAGLSIGGVYHKPIALKDLRAALA